MTNRLTTTTFPTYNQLTTRKIINKSKTYSMRKIVKPEITKIYIFPWADVNQFQEVKKSKCSGRYCISGKLPPEYKYYAIGAAKENVCFSAVITWRKKPGEC